jgi:RNA polymerase sigma-70 factor (ECF subfamily)
MRAGSRDRRGAQRTGSRVTLRLRRASPERETCLDEEAIREFVETEYPRLVALVALACGSLSLAEDAVQEAVARAWERTERGEAIHSWKAWITVVALNLTRSQLRRIRAERRAVERLSGTGPSEPVAPEEIADLRRAIIALPHKQRDALILRFFLGERLSEIAEGLGLSEGAVKSTLYRARRALAQRLQEPSTEEDSVAERG